MWHNILQNKSNNINVFTSPKVEIYACTDEEFASLDIPYTHYNIFPVMEAKLYQ